MTTLSLEYRVARLEAKLGLQLWPAKGKYALGGRSLVQLRGVSPDLVACAHYALRVCAVDFSVRDGLRTMEEQKVLVAKGRSRTLNSRHLTGHALDLVPYLDGELTWDWVYVDAVAKAMGEAARELNVRVTWGAVWDRAVDEVFEDPKTARQSYKRRFFRNNDRNPFSDGPHYQVPTDYPTDGFRSNSAAAFMEWVNAGN